MTERNRQISYGLTGQEQMIIPAHEYGGRLPPGAPRYDWLVTNPHGVTFFMHASERLMQMYDVPGWHYERVRLDLSDQEFVCMACGKIYQV